MKKFIDNYETFVESLKQGKEYLKQGKLNQDILDSIVSIDNTKTKKYVGWLSKMYINEPFDIGSMKSYIEEYNVLVNRNLIEKDINKFKSISSFKSEVDNVNSTKSASNKELQNDYDVILDNDTFYIVRPNTFEASRKLGLSTFAHRNNEETGNKDSAWCTTYSNDNHWNNYYYSNNVTFYYCKIKDKDLINKLNKSYKTNKDKTDLSVFAVAVLDDNQLDIYDGNDAQIQEPNELTDELKITNLMVSHIDKEEREKRKILNIIKLFEKEIIEGDVTIDFEITNDIKCNTKVIKGNVTIKNINYIPSFFKNIKINSNFNCYYNKLTTLEGAPQSVSGNFNCYSNKLTTLEGAPHTVGGSFNCSDNELTSLEGAPQSVGGDFYCHYNNLTSLVGVPHTVSGNFYCFNNNLTSLKGAPQSVKGYFNCSDNELTSLEGTPQSVGGYFNCSDNKLISLEGAPQSVGGNFNCSDNKLITDEHIEWLKQNCEIKGEIFK